MKKLLSVVLLCGVSYGVSALDLKEAVALAEHHDAGFMAAVAQYAADRSAIGVARGGLLPNVGVSWSLGRTRTSVYTPQGAIVGSGTGKSWSLKVNQALLDLSTYDKFVSAEHMSLASYQQLRLAWFQLVLKTSQAYFDVLSARLSLSAIVLSERAMYQHYLMAQRNFDIGNSSVVDMLQAKASLDSISAQRIQALQSLSIKRMALIHLIGEKLGHLLPLNARLAYPDLDRAALLRLLKDADRYAPQIVAAYEGERATSWLGYAARAAYWPKIGVGLSRDYNNRASVPGQPGLSMIPGIPTYATTVGLQLNWTLFAGGALLSGAEQASHLHEKAFQQWIDARRQVFLALESHYALYQSARAQEQAYAQAVASADTLLKAVSLGYETGNNTMLDLLDAEKQLSALRQQWIQSRLNALLSYLQVKVTAGVLTRHDIDQMNKAFFTALSAHAAHGG